MMKTLRLTFVFLAPLFSSYALANPAPVAAAPAAEQVWAQRVQLVGLAHNDTFVAWGIPGIAVLMGAALCALGWWGSRRFTAAYPDSSIATTPTESGEKPQYASMFVSVNNNAPPLEPGEKTRTMRVEGVTAVSNPREGFVWSNFDEEVEESASKSGTGIGVSENHGSPIKGR